jgi:hypothetical protein
LRRGRDRPLRDAEDLGGGAVVEALCIHEQDGGAIIRRERGGRPSEPGPQLDGLRDRRGVRRLGVRLDEGKPTYAPELLVADVVDDPVEPGRERRLATKTGKRAERPHVGLLERVVHAVAVAEEPVRERPQPFVDTPDERGERVVVDRAGECELDLLAAGGSLLAVTAVIAP